jgi:hypothetical protein
MLPPLWRAWLFEPVGEIIGQQNHLSALIVSDVAHRLSPLPFEFALLPKGYEKRAEVKFRFAFWYQKANFPSCKNVIKQR